MTNHHDDKTPKRGCVPLFAAALTLVLALVAGGSARTAYADSRAIGFENPPYTTGSIDGKDGWSGGGLTSTDPIATSIDQAVTGADFKSGSQSWRISNNTPAPNGAFGTWPFGPPLGSDAGQPSSGAASSRFFASFWFKSGSTVADGSNIEVDLGTTTGDDRNSFLAITNKADANGGLQLRIDEPVENGSGGCDNFYPTLTPATNLDRSVWHRVDFRAQFIDGDYNDTIEYFLDGKPLTNTRTGGTTWFTFESYRNQCGYPYAQTNRIYFRSGAPPSGYGAFSDGGAAGIFFDNLTYETSCGTRYVATTGSDIAGNQCDVALNPCLTIQHAVDVTCPGDTVLVAAGTYAENIVVTTTGVTLAGAGQGATIIEPASSNPNPCTGSSLCGGLASNIILVQADNVTIHDVTLEGDNPNLTSGIIRNGADLDARNGIITDYRAGDVRNLLVYNATVQNVYLRGLYSSSAGTGNTFDFHDNTVRNVQGDYYSIGMFAYAASGRMARNTVTDAGDAISANWSLGIQFVNNTVSGSGSGVHSDNSGGSGSNAPDLIQGNRVSDCTAGGYGVWVFAPYVAPAVRGNTVTNCDVGLAAAGGNAATVFSDNVVDGMNRSGSVGVYVTTSLFGWGSANVSATFEGNLITGNTDGFQLQDKTCSGHSTQGCTADSDCPSGETCATGYTLTVDANCNRITGNDTGVLTEALTNPATAVFGSNVIAGNSTGIDGTALGAPMDAQNNYWGCADGPGNAGCDTVIGNVDVSPVASSAPACAYCSQDSECDDGLGCNGPETCDPSSHICQTGSPVDCSSLNDACNVAACTDPSGTCQVEAKPDGTTCGGGNTCQAGSCTSGSSLSLAAVRLHYNTGTLRDNGSVFVRAVVNDDDTGGQLPGDLVDRGGVTVEVRDNGSFHTVIALNNCERRGTHGRVVCTDRENHTSARFTRLKYSVVSYGLLYRVTVSRSRLGTADTGSGALSGPVQVVLHQLTVDRPSDIQACQTAGLSRLLCRN